MADSRTGAGNIHDEPKASYSPRKDGLKTEAENRNEEGVSKIQRSNQNGSQRPSLK